MTFLDSCALALAGCATTPPVPPAPQALRIPCAVLPPHTTLEQGVLAGELPGDGPESQRWLEEYTRLRLSCRAAENVR